MYISQSPTFGTVERHSEFVDDRTYSSLLSSPITEPEAQVSVKDLRSKISIFKDRYSELEMNTINFQKEILNNFDLLETKL